MINDICTEQSMPPPRKRGGGFSNPYLKLPLPRHTTYVETKGSRDALAFYKPASKVEVLNDDDGEVFNLTRVMMNPRTRTAFQSARASRLRPNDLDDDANGSVERAVGFVRSVERAVHQNFAAKTGLRKGIRRLDDPFSLVVARLGRFQIERETTEGLLRRYDWSKALFVCDERGRNWKSPESASLLDALRRVVGKVMLIPDPSNLPSTALPGWRREIVAEDHPVLMNY